MNNYEKLGTFLSRIVGLALGIYGAMILAVVAYTSPPPDSLLWRYPFVLLGVGVVVYLTKKVNRTRSWPRS